MTEHTGYNRTSIVLHWLSAVAIVALFVTHEGPRDGAAMQFHVGGGAIIGLVLLYRVARRFRRGMPPKPSQNVVLNFIARLVLVGFLLAIVVVTATGYLLPWSLGRPLEVFGWSIGAPMAANRAVHEITEWLHSASGHVFVPLLLLHLAGTIKHWLIDRDDVAARMFKTGRSMDAH